MGLVGPGVAMFGKDSNAEIEDEQSLSRSSRCTTGTVKINNKLISYLRERNLIIGKSYLTIITLIVSVLIITTIPYNSLLSRIHGPYSKILVC